ncbi:hypothetical protein QAD02_012945 [Eretmocerus hayati]|uniref:Uncharacterized protein n=1 Tax=Eretmocerus hayati TaxID=131215 RepID=A0ACC2P217_9HYME|nr:hypothetical protein QAD02_012945 [Eretmocerus hayati]
MRFAYVTDYYTAQKVAQAELGSEGVKESPSTSGCERSIEKPSRYREDSPSYGGEESSNSESDGKNEDSTSQSESSESDDEDMMEDRSKNEKRALAELTNVISKDKRSSAKAKKQKTSDNSATQNRIFERGFKVIYKGIQELGSRLPTRIEGQAADAKADMSAFPKFPLSTGTGVVTLEDLLEKEEHKRNFDTWIGDIGGKEATDFVWNVLDDLFDPKYLTKFSWSGQ